jgi:hypothetical protein
MSDPMSDHYLPKSKVSPLGDFFMHAHNVRLRRFLLFLLHLTTMYIADCKFPDK